MKKVIEQFAAVIRDFGAARRARAAERALLALDARTLRDIGIESYQPGLAEYIAEHKRLDTLRSRAALLGQL